MPGPGFTAQFPERPARVLAFLRSFHGEHAWMPTVREICDGCAISSKSTTVYYLDQLERDGFIEREHGRESARCIRLTAKGEAA